MKKQLKKLLALTMALAMALQCAPVLADEPTVTVSGTKVVVTTGDVEGKVQVWTQSNENHEDGDIMIDENNVVWIWQEGQWVEYLDEEQNPVDPSTVQATVPDVSTYASATIGGNNVDMVDKTGNVPEKIDSLTVNLEDVTDVSDTTASTVYAYASSEADPVETIVNVGNVSATTDDHSEFDPEKPWMAAVDTGVDLSDSAKKDGSVSVKANVDGDVTVNAKSENLTSNARGVLINPSAEDQGKASIEAAVSGDVTAVSASENGGAYAYGVGVNPMATGKSETSAKVTVEGSVTTSAAGGKNTTSIGVNVNPYEQDDAKATAAVEVKGSVEATASSDSSKAYAVGVQQADSNSTGGTAEVKAGDVTAAAQGGKNTEAVGVNAQIYSGSNPDTQRTVTVGDVTATAELAKSEDENLNVYSNGVFTRSNTPGGSVDVTAGDVTAKTVNNNETGETAATGLNAQVQGGEVSIAAGNVSAEASGGQGNVAGIRTRAETAWTYDEETDEWYGSAPSPVSIAADSVTAEGDSGDVRGVLAENYGSDMDIQVKGNVDAANSSKTQNTYTTGVYAVGSSEKTNIKTGDVTVTSQGATIVEQRIYGYDQETGDPITGTYTNVTEAHGVDARVGYADEGTEVNVTTGNVTVTSEATTPADNGFSYVYSEGVNAQNQTPDSSVQVKTGDVAVSAVNKNEGGQANARGISATSKGGEVSVEAGKVTVEADSYMSTATGIAARTSSGWVYDEEIEDTVEAVGESKLSVTAESVTVEAEKGYAVAVEVNNNGQANELSVAVSGDVQATAESDKSSVYAYGVNGTVYGPTSVEIGGDVTVTAKGEFDRDILDNNDIYYRGTSASGLTVLGQGASEETELTLSAGDVTVSAETLQGDDSGYNGTTWAHGVNVKSYNANNDFTVEVGDVTVTTTENNNNGYSQVNGLVTEVDGSTGKVNAGNVTAEADGSNPYAQGVIASSYIGFANGERSQGELSVEVGDVTAVADDGTAYGANLTAFGAEIEMETGSVTAEGGHFVMGVNIVAGDTNYKDIDGNIVQVYDGSVDLTANGDVTAVATANDGEAKGLKIQNTDADVSVTVQGDVTAEGADGTGIFVQNKGEGTTAIVVDGTVSGSTNSIEVLNSSTTEGKPKIDMTPENVSLTVWAAEKNDDGHVAVAVDRQIIPGNAEHPAPTNTDTVNEKATATLEAAINYIVKIAKDFAQQVTASGEKKQTVTVGDTTYATAKENENVNVGVTLDAEKEVLEGIYYNADDAETLTKTEDLTKAEDGSFLMKMLRGGAMLLGLKIHTHEYVYVYNNDATCTQDGTETATCSCGKTNGTRTKENSKLGHSFTNYVSNNDAKCTTDGTKTAKCDRCTATDTIADAGSALGHSFTNYVSDGNATCKDDGTKTATCDNVCGTKDTIPDEGSHLKVAHTAGQPTLVNVGGTFKMVVYCTVCDAELFSESITPDNEPEPDQDPQFVPDTEPDKNDTAGNVNDQPENGNETPKDENKTPADPEPEKMVTSETSTAADGSAVTKELETSSETKQNDDGTVTVTDTVKETLTTENKDGSVVEVKTESTKEETTGSQKNEDGSVTDTTTVNITETVTETATDADGNKVVMETKTETESNTAVTTAENEDGSVTEKTENKETVKVTEKVTDAEGNVTETVTETTTETVTNMTRNEDGTETGTSTTTATVKDEQGKVLSESVTEAEIKVSTDENGTKTTETKATTTTKDADGNETVETTVTTENKTADGSTGTIVKDDSGNVLAQETTISQEEFEQATAENRPIQVPLTVDPGILSEAGELPPIKVTLPPSYYDKDGDGKVAPGERPKIEIQVTLGGSGVIVAEVGPDGNLRIRKDCYEGSVIVPLIGSGNIVVFDNAKTFTDVSENDWYYEYVTFVTAREIINGVDEDTFAPGETMSRADLAQMLYGFDPTAKEGNGAQFDDVNADDQFSGAVGWACEHEIMEGNEGSFKPMDEVACQDMITALYRWAEAAGYDVSARARIDTFSDADSAADYAKDALRWAAGWGLIGGEDDGALTLTGTVTRAQAAAIMTRFVRNAR